MLRCVSGCCLLLFSMAVLTADQSSVHTEGLRSHPPAVWALQGATVVLNPDVTVSPATIIVRRGKIEAVGTDVHIPDDAQVVDMTGKTIYPGFIDAYSEKSLATDRLAGTSQYWNNNVVPHLSVAEQLDTGVSAGDTARRQGFVAQLVAPADGIVRGLSALVTTGDGSPNELLIAADVAQHLELTVARRGGRSGYPSSPMGAVALARQAMYDAAWYRDSWAAVAADPTLPLPERNDALAALEATLNGSRPVIIETSNELFFLRAERFASEFGLNLIVRGSGNEYRRIDEIAATGRTVILPLSFPDAPNVASPELAQEVSLESLMNWDIAPENPARVDAAGIRFAFSTDGLSSVGEFLKELRKAVTRGLTPASALRALTVTPASLFGVEEQLGSIGKGRLASFVITDGDLFESKTRIVETWVNGTRYEYDPAQPRQLSGRYELQLAEHGELPNRLYVEIEHDGSKVTGRISRKPIPDAAAAGARTNDSSDTADSAETAATSDKPKDDTQTSSEAGESRGGARRGADPEIQSIAGLKLSDSTLSGTVSGKAWALDGTIRLSLVFAETNLAQADRAVGFGSVVWPDGALVPLSVHWTGAAGKEKSSDAAAGEHRDAARDVSPPAAANDGPGNEEQTREQSDDADPEADKVRDALPSTGSAAPPSDKSSSFPVNFPLGAFGRSEIPSQVPQVAFMHATIWTCGPEGIIEDATLIVGDGQILAVGRDIEIPDGTEMIDVRGMQITPGLIDCHSHMATDGGVNEGTQAITCEVRIGDFIDSDDITIYRQLAGGVTAANILHGSANPIGGQNQVIKLRWGQSGEHMKFTEAPQGVKFALGENVKQSNWSEPTGRYPQTRMGVEQLFRDSFEAALDYGRRMDAWENNRRGLPPRRDLELDALREMLENTRWIHCHSYRQDEILALIRVLDEYGITIGTFQHILEGYKVADAMAQHGAMASAFSDWWAYKIEVYDAIPYAGAIMHNAGVVVSFNSDDAELARHLNQEAAKAVKYGGISPEEALKFVTLNPAKQLRIDEYVGSIEVGKQADFVIWNGDPLSNFTRCEQTWIDGRRYFDRHDDELLMQQARDMRNTLIQKILRSGDKMRRPGERDNDPAALWPRHDEFCHHSHDDETHEVINLQLRQLQMEQNYQSEQK